MGCHFARPILVLAVLSSTVTVKGSDEPNPLDELAIIATHHGIDIDVSPTFPVRTAYGQVDGCIAELPAILHFARLFAYEFTLYPEDLVRRSQLKRVVFCAELSLSGQSFAGFADCTSGVIYLDVSDGKNDVPHQIRTIHHEFFHIIDNRDDGSLVDESWKLLNPAGFTYGPSGRARRNLLSRFGLSADSSGFLTAYSSSAVHEDKAELFSMLVVDSGEVDRRVRADAVLEAKVPPSRPSLTGNGPRTGLPGLAVPSGTLHFLRAVPHVGIATCSKRWGTYGPVPSSWLSRTTRVTSALLGTPRA